MIYSVSCDKPSFRKVEFKSGFNVILAERTQEATKKDSRNGLGKSTLIEIIHFCLGGQKGETLSKKAVENWTFAIDIDLGNERYVVKRNTAETNRILVEGNFSEWPIKPELDKKTRENVISSRDWTRVLGNLVFGLPINADESKYVPTFRSLISYFIRKDGNNGAFLDPFQNYKAQQEWDRQVANGFLLDLGWEYARGWQVLKDRESVLGQIKQEAESGILSNLMGSVGELEAKKIRLESITKFEEEQLKSFKVHPQYSQIEKDANSLTNQIHDLVNQNITDLRVIDQYEESLKDEEEASPEKVTKVYEEAGIVIPSLVKKKIGDVLSFHRQVVSNRKEFLNSEIGRLKSNVAKRKIDVQDLSNKRSELMQVLHSHKALEEYTRLQSNHQRTLSELKDVAIKIENMKKFEQGKSSINVEKEVLQQKANIDLKERESQKKKAILLFNENSKTLYEAPGTLSIDVSKTGFKFKVDIERSGSHAIGNMKIFCYDLVLAQLWSSKTKTTLIHDSIIFADVDERQRALALQLAAKESEEKGFQYICTLNSDAIPQKDFSQDFDFNSYVRARFTDANDDGGLLGIRF